MVWFDNDYGYKKKITIDHTKVAGDETDFPVLISVTDNDLRDEANGGHVKHASGWDIIFTNSAETVQLKHEIERYINTSGLLVFWVKVSSLSSTVDTDIYIYYGKAGVGVDPSSTDTWNADYLAVWHMTDTHDSTSNSHDGTNFGASPVAGKIGGCYDFEDTESDYISVADHADLDLLATNFTIETWVNVEGWGTVGDWTKAIASKTETTPDRTGWTYFIRGAKDDARKGKQGFAVYDYDECFSDTVVPKNAWHHTVVTFEYKIAANNDVKFYLDTVADGGEPAFTEDVLDNVGNLGIGSRIQQSIFYFDGKIDELRISTVLRSTNYITTTYNTQDDPAGFMSWGTEETSATGSNVYYNDGTQNIEWQRDDASPVQKFNGVEIVGLKLGNTNDPNASPAHVFVGTAIKAILRMP